MSEGVIQLFELFKVQMKRVKKLKRMGECK